MSARLDAVRPRAWLLVLSLAVGTAGCDLMLDAFPDETPPSVRIEEPPGPLPVVTADSVITVSGVAIDDRGVERVTYSRDSTERDTQVDPGSVVSFRIRVEARPEADTVTIRAYDGEGNRGSVRIPAPIHDTAPPVITLTAPADDLGWTDGRFRLAGEAVDANGTDRVVVDYSRAGGRHRMLATLPARFDTTLAITAPIAEVVRVRVTAYDLLEHASSTVFELLVDAIPPRPDFFYSRPRSVAEPLSHFTFGIHRGDLSPLVSLRYVSGSDTVDLATNRTFYESIGVPAGPGRATILARDEAGNAASSSLAWLGLAFRELHGPDQHVCMLTADGEAYCMGRDAEGQLGNGPEDGTGEVPVPVAGGLLFAAVRAGAVTTCGLDDVGRAYCWGSNEHGQLGDGTRTDRAAPTPVAGDHMFTEIHPAERSTCALDDAGTPFCWGLVVSGDPDVPWDTVTEPRAVPAPAPLVTMGTHPDADHVCGLDAYGAAYCWGRTDGYDAAAATTTWDTTAVLVDPGPFVLVQPMAEPWKTPHWTFALTDAGAATTLGGTGDPALVEEEYGPGPWEDAIAAGAEVCVLSDVGGLRCISSAPPAVAESDASRLGLEAAAYTAVPCFLTPSGSLYCRPLDD